MTGIDGLHLTELFHKILDLYSKKEYQVLVFPNLNILNVTSTNENLIILRNLQH